MDKQELKRPDAFVQKGRGLIEFFLARRERFLVVLVAGAVLVAGVFVYDWWEDRQTEKSWDVFAEVMKLPADKDERWEKLKTAYQKDLSGRAKQFAAVAIADHYFSLARTKALKGEDGVKPLADDAATWYSNALTARGILPAEQQLFLLNRGESMELSGQWDAASKEYQVALEKAVEGKPLVLLAMARVHEAKQETDKALEIYAKIAADYANTEYAKSAKNEERRLKNPLFRSANKG